MGAVQSIPRLDTTLLPPDALSTQIGAFLQQLQDERTLRILYVHLQPISFPTAQDKANWAGYRPPEDHAGWDTFLIFLCADQQSCSLRLGLISSLTCNWVADREWDTRAWHV
jgi:hypothetical protein